MKTRLIITSIVLCFCNHFLKAQDTITRDMIYHATVRILSDPSFNYSGTLFEVNDSSISISSRRIKDLNSGNVEAVRFPVEDLEYIYTNKAGSGGKGALIGAASGVALGALFGAVTANSTILSAGENMAVFGSFGFVVGAPLGFIYGKAAGHKTTRINGSMDEFNVNKEILKDYAIKK